MSNKKSKDRADIQKMLDILHGYGYTDGNIAMSLDLPDWWKARKPNYPSFEPTPELKAVLALCCLYPSMLRDYDRAMIDSMNGKDISSLSEKPTPEAMEILTVQNIEDDELATLVGQLKNPMAIRVMELRLKGEMKKGDSLFHRMIEGKDA